MARRMAAVRGARGALLVAALVALLGGLAVPATAYAHERRAVGGYELVVGFFVEPAIEGEKNGLDLRITKDGAPVEGAHETLTFDVTHVQSNASKSYPVRAVFGTPGRYTADFIPTLSGQYRFVISGTIEGTAIDETFESGPGTFGNVEPVAELQFPVAAAQPRELQGALEGALEDARAAEDAAGSARLLAIVGIAIGAVGVGIGATALVAARARRD